MAARSRGSRGQQQQPPPPPPQQQQQASGRSNQEELTAYSIVVMTSDIPGAGTDANVSVRLYGEGRKSTQVFELKESINHHDKFERKHIDAFFFKDVPSVGKLESIQVYHDATSHKPNWHLAGIEVNDAGDNMSYYFACKRWLSKTMGDGKVNLLLRLTKTKEKTAKHLRPDSSKRSQSQRG